MPAQTAHLVWYSLIAVFSTHRFTAELFLQAKMADSQGSCKCPEAAYCSLACPSSCSVADAPGIDDHPLAASQPKSYFPKALQQE